MTTLISGGCGFVGAYVAKRLAADGEDVIAFDNNPSPAILDLVLTPSERRRVEIVQGDLLDLAQLMRVGRNRGVNRVAHLAYMIMGPTKANPGLAQQVNVVGTNNMFELALALNAPRVVWVSTVDVFGRRSIGADGVIANDAVYDPQGIYGACKLLNEVAAKDYATAFGLDPIALRIPTAYGAGTARSWTRWLPEMVRNLVNGSSAEAPKLKKIVTWLYVEDVADAVVRGFNAPTLDQRGLTLSGTPRGVDEVVEIVRGHFPNGKVDLVDVPESGTMSRYDGKPTEAHLGWRPAHSLEQGIERMIDIYRRAATAA